MIFNAMEFNHFYFKVGHLQVPEHNEEKGQARRTSINVFAKM